MSPNLIIALSRDFRAPFSLRAARDWRRESPHLFGGSLNSAISEKNCAARKVAGAKPVPGRPVNNARLP